MPSRTASALAPLRVRAPSFRRIAETWWLTVFSERNSRAANLGVREPLGAEPDDLQLPRRQVARVPQRGGTRAARDPPHATLAESSGDDGRRRRAEPLELLKGSPEGVLVAVCKRKGRLVRTAELRPELRGAHPLADELEGVRFCGGGRSLLEESRPSAPAGERADVPRRLAAKRRLKQGTTDLGR